MRCGYCGREQGAHDNCEQAFENGATWDHYDEGYLIPEPHRTEMLELAAIREAAEAESRQR